LIVGYEESQYEELETILEDENFEVTFRNVEVVPIHHPEWLSTWMTRKGAEET
jgi:hypothetical protein